MKKALMLCMGPKRVCCHRGLNSQPRAWHIVPIFRAKCDTTQLSKHPKIFSVVKISILRLLIFESNISLNF